MGNSRRKNKRKISDTIFIILGIEMLIALLVVGGMAVKYGGALVMKMKANRQPAPQEAQGVQATFPEVVPPAEPVTEERTEVIDNTVNLVAVGDNLMHRSSTMSGLQADGSYDYTANFANTAAVFRNADLAVISQDTVMGGSELGVTSSETGIFNTNLEIGDSMAAAGINVVLAANNHIMDEGKTGLETMMNFWADKYPEVSLIGVNSSEEQKNTPVYVEKDGIKFALINFAYGSNVTDELDAAPYLMNTYDENWLSGVLEQARSEADFIIAFPFWGQQDSLEYTVEQETQAQFLADNGVDLIIGSYPHVIEPVKWVTAENGDKALVYYSLGNYQSVQSTVENMLGGMAEVTIKKDEQGTYISDYDLGFVVTHYAQNSASDYYDIVTTYMLDDYTDELAAAHGILAYAPDFSVASLQSLKDQILAVCDMKKSDN